MHANTSFFYSDCWYKNATDVTVYNMTIFFLFLPICQSNRVLEQSLTLFMNYKKFKVKSPYFLLLSYLQSNCDIAEVKY